MSGKVTGVTGVSVAISGAATANATVDPFGAFSTARLTNGSYTVTPTLNGYSFSPLSQAVIVSDGNVTVPDFMATPSVATTYSVSGRVTYNGVVQSWVRIDIADVFTPHVIVGSTFSDGNGDYLFPAVPDGLYNVMMDKTGYVGKPISSDGNIGLTVSGASLTGKDFLVYPPGSGGATIDF
jgi:inhibitor of cysteine peptidase